MKALLSSKTIVSVFSNWGRFAITLLLSFFMAPFLVHHLGKSDYGLWAIISSFIGFMGIIDLGINNAIVRYMSKYLTEGDHEKANQTYSASVVIFGLIAGIIMILAAIAAEFFPAIFNAEGSHFFLKAAVLLAGLDFALSLPIIVFQAIAKAKQQFLLLNIVNVANRILRSIAFVLLLLGGYGLLALLVAQLILDVTSGVFLAICIYRNLPGLRFQGIKIDLNSAKELLGYSFFNVFIVISSKLIYQTDVLVIGAFFSAEWVTYYAIGASLINYLQNLMRGLHGVIVPKASRLEASERSEELSKLLLTYSRYSILIATPIIFVFIYYGESFIGIWMGQNFGELAGKVLLILAVAKFANIPQLVSNAVLRGIGKLKFLAAVRIGEGVANLGLSLFLVQEYGLVGVAVGTLVPAIISNSVILPVYIRRQFGFSLRDYYWQGVLRPILSILLLSLFSSLLDFKPNTYPAFLGVISANMIVYLVFVYAFCLRKAERDRIIGYVRNFQNSFVRKFSV